MLGLDHELGPLIRVLGHDFLVSRDSVIMENVHLDTYLGSGLALHGDGDHCFDDVLDGGRPEDIVLKVLEKGDPPN